MMKDRVILHCDCNSFFASVETALNPDLKNVPMAVCGSQEDRHGIVLAKNELAKKYGIVTAETVFSAKKKCKNLVICEPHHDLYHEYSKRANAIYAKYTDIIEPFGIDESWLDVTASKYIGTGAEIAEKIKLEIKKELDITVSIGVSFNKVFAKLGSDYKKPDAITVISRENYKNILYPLPVSDMLFVGKRTSDELKRMGILTIGDLAAATPEILISRFGKAGEMLSKYSRGEDDSPVISADAEDTKSVGNGFTFKHDLKSREECRAGIDYLSASIGRRLRLHGLKCLGIAISVKDEFLHTIQRQRQLNAATDDSRIIANFAYSILIDEWNENRPIRSITITAINLLHGENVTEQIDFFSKDNREKKEKNEKREEALDKIRGRFGADSITNASVINTDIGVYKSKKKKQD